MGPVAVNYAPCWLLSLVSVNNESQPDRILHTPPLQGSEPARALPGRSPQKKSYINAIYGALDGLSTSYSFSRCYFDTMYANTSRSSSDLIHEWLMTTEGLAIAVSESCIIISLTYIANVTDKKDKKDKKDKNSLKQYISQYFPYLRDTFKSLKNANRSIRATLQAIDKLFNKEFTKHALLIGAFLGILAAINRAFIRYSRNQRTEMIKKNIALLILIQKSPELTTAKHLEHKKNINYEGKPIGRASLCTAFYSGLVDGLYLHMGMMTLAPLPPPLFILVFALSAFFSLLCIITRVYEIYNEQCDLLITQEKINLTLCGIELQALIIEVLNQSKNPSLDTLSRLELKLHELDEIRSNLQSNVTQSYKTAFLAGLRGGLAAYGALESLMFGIFTITSLTSISFSPSLLMGAIISGLACLLGFAAYSVIQHYLDQQRLVGQIDNSKKELDDYITRLKHPPGDTASLGQEALRNPAEIKKMITERMKIIPSPQPSFQERFEIFRALFSGIGKGQKAVDFTLYALQQADEKARYHDTPLMLWVMTLFSIIYAFVFAKRASSSYQTTVNLKESILKSSILDDEQPLPTEQNTLLANAPTLEVNAEPINIPSKAPAENPVIATNPTSWLEGVHGFFGHSSKKSPQRPQTDIELRHNEPSTGCVMALSP